MRVIRSVVLLAVAGALSLGLVACGGSSSGKSAPPAAAAVTSVHIKNLAFSPTPLQVKAGQKVTIVNDDTLSHTFTADAGGFDSGIIAAGATATVTVSGTGTVAYHCKIHPTMKGTLQVA